ncbi:hypothetical protein [Chitinophaga vietnamensis]|uniref:hypothetical protein n=1 Tax=Chitinophaga vietnamensis TaxID=2593957 RepID=UPI001177AB2E|nr:hypothetical protein [Chitinophaga vietnamensis]
MKKAMCSGILGLLITITALTANAQSGTDTVLTTRGAVTLITCGSPISTFQIGDGKNTDYDYRIVDGNMAFVRPVVASPRPTNLIVREGENIHYMILSFRPTADLGKLKYALSKPKGSKTAAKEPEDVAVNSKQPAEHPAGGDKISTLPDLPEDDATLISIDTVTVSKIAEDFGNDRKGSHQYEIKAEGVTLSYAQAMTLNNLNYFCFNIKNHSKEPFTIVKTSLLHKDKEDNAQLHGMPILYKRGPATIGGKSTANEVIVVPSKQFKKDDEVIVVLKPASGKQLVALYLPASALPKYMVSK